MTHFKRVVGSKLQVYNGTAQQTRHGLVKADLIKRKHRIVSRKRSEAANKNPHWLHKWAIGVHKKRSTAERHAAHVHAAAKSRAKRAKKHKKKSYAKKLLALRSRLR